MSYKFKTNISVSKPINDYPKHKKKKINNIKKKLKIVSETSPPQTNTPPPMLQNYLPLFDRNGQRVSAPDWCRCRQTWLKVHLADPT